MKHCKRRRLAGTLAALLLLTALTVPAAALTPTRPVTGAYRSSTYHQNLLNIPRTGDEAFDTVAVAMTQVGYHEGNSTADFDGKNKSGTRNFTEYNRILGKIDGSYSYAWCAAFVSWCLIEADAADAAGGLFASCSLWLEALRAEGRYSSRASGYRPKEGDLIFFRSSGAGRASDHVGLVRYVDGGRVYTVEGNSSDKVSLNSYALSNTYIVGYGKPNYGEDLIPSTAFSLEDRTNGWYVVTNDFVNIRTGAGTSFSKSGRLYLGDTVRVLEIQNGWGAFLVAGEVRYLSLDYATFVSPLTYRVSYDANGGENAPEALAYLSHEQRTVSEQLPVRAAYSFLYWQDGQGRSYAGGDPLPGESLTLTAVWEPIPVQEPPEAAPPTEAPDTPSGGGDSDPPQSDSGTEYLQPSPPEAPVPLPEQAPSPTEADDLTAADIATAIAVILLTAGGIFAYIWHKKRHT